MARALTPGEEQQIADALRAIRERTQALLTATARAPAGPPGRGDALSRVGILLADIDRATLRISGVLDETNR